MIRSFRTPLFTVLVCAMLIDVPHTQSLDYPKPKKVDVVDDYFGTKVADPYRWMEDLNAPEVTRWVEAQNAVTFKYLDTLPMREGLRKRITELWNYARVSAPSLQRRALVLFAQHRPPASGRRLHAREPDVGRDDRDRPQRAVARRVDRVGRLRAVAGRDALRLRAVGRRIGLVHLPRAGVAAAARSGPTRFAG